MRCFKCDGEVDIGGDAAYPNDSLVFEARGNYGSTLFDPVGDYGTKRRPTLTVLLCDQCVRAGRTNVIVSDGGESECDWGETP